MGRRGIEGFDADIARWRREAGDRAPSYDRFFAEVAAMLDGELGARLSDVWRDREFFAFYDRPLLIVASVRMEAFAEGAGHPLYAALAADDPDPQAITSDAVRDALAPERTRTWEGIETRVVQTNETTRGVAWLWPAELAGAGSGARSLALIDVGASAGLNLIVDALPNVWVDAGGAPLAVATRPRVVSRLGLDARPLDARNDDDAAWLRACVWAGQTDRLERLDAAITAFRAASGRADAPVLHPCRAEDAPPLIAKHAATAPSDALVVAYQTIMRDYLPPEVRDAYTRGMRAWVESEPPGRACWIELELLPDTPRATPASIVAHVRPREGAVESLVLARCGYHPRDVHPDAEHVARFREIAAG